MKIEITVTQEELEEMNLEEYEMHEVLSCGISNLAGYNVHDLEEYSVQVKVEG